MGMSSTPRVTATGLAAPRLTTKCRELQQRSSANRFRRNTGRLATDLGLQHKIDGATDPGRRPILHLAFELCFTFEENGWPQRFDRTVGRLAPFDPCDGDLEPHEMTGNRPQYGDLRLPFLQ